MTEKKKANAAPKKTAAKPKAEQIKGEILTAETPLIFPKMIAIMRGVGKIGKDRENPSQHYAFRGIDDVYNELHNVLAKEGVITIPEVLEERAEDRQSSSGKQAIYRILKIKYQFCAEDGSHVDATVIGEGMDWGDKAANKAMSVAHKYALLQIFCIPTAEPKDPEADEDIPAGEKTRSHGGKKATPPKDDSGKAYPMAKFVISGEEKLLTKFDALDLFKGAKGHLGKEDYYKVLNGFEFNKSNEIPLEQMREVYEAMIAVYQERVSRTKTEKPKEKK